MCIDDQWHEATSVKEANNSQLLQDIDISVVIADSISVTIKWSGQQSSPNDKNISGYDLSCKTSSLSDHGQIHEVRVSNISTSTTRVQVSGLLPGTAYQCCVNAHIQTNTPLDLMSSNCVIASTTSVQEPNNDGLIIGLGSGLGICSLLLLVSVVSMLVGLIVSKICSSCFKCDFTMQGKIKRYTILIYLCPFISQPCSSLSSLILLILLTESLKSMTWCQTPFIISPCNALHNKV